VSGIGGRAPRHLPVWADVEDDFTAMPRESFQRFVDILRGLYPSARLHRNEYLLPLQIDSRTRRVGVMPRPAAEQAEAAARRELVVKARHVAAALRREQQRQARIAAGVDRSSPDAGPRPRWSR
jgi:hypothetical protein